MSSGGREKEVWPSEQSLAVFRERESALGARVRAVQLRGLLTDVANHAWLLHPLVPSGLAGSTDLAKAIAPAINQLRRLEQQEPVFYKDLDGIVGALAERAVGGRAANVGPQARVSVPLLLMPAAPILASGLPGGLLADTQMTPEEFEKLIEALKQFLRDLHGEMTKDEWDALEKYVLAVWSAITQAERAGPGGEAALELLKQALIDLINAVAGRGGHLAEWLLDALRPLYVRIIEILGGEAAGEAGFILIDFLFLLVFLMLWALMWVKIGTWFWNRPIDGGGETYIDFWARHFYELVHDRTCDDLLEEWRQADQDLRQAEGAGQDLGQLTIAAIHAEACADTLLKRCPVDIKNVIKSRLGHYQGIVDRFERMVDPHGR